VSQDKKPDFSAVAGGPESSEQDADGAGTTVANLPEHASVIALEARFGKAIQRHLVCAGDEHVVYVDEARSKEILGWLKDDPEQHYNHLADVTAVDYGSGRPLEVVYQLWSIPHRRALRLKCELPLSGLSIDSVTSLWAGANWLEREVYDLFGIEFRDHPDPRRILMPENYAEGHPLRKDFPLQGRFSRAEQTKRALSQDPADFYTPEQLNKSGRAPQVMPADSADVEEGTPS